MKISYVGLKNLDDLETAKIKNLSIEYCEKFERDLGKDALLILHLQKYKVEGKRAKYSIHAKINSPSLILNANAADWDLNRVLHKVLKKFKGEIEHKFKPKPKPYGFKKRLISLFLRERKK